MRTLVVAALLMTSVPAFGGPAGGAAEGHGRSRLSMLMSAEEFAAAGLEILTPEQMAALERWMADYESRLRTRPGHPRQPVVESRVDGDFDGWEGQTVFRLTNGQVWQQSSPSAKYFFANSPLVTITTDGPFRLRVEGLDAEVQVRRIR